jgi:hypothetical protein
VNLYCRYLGKELGFGVYCIGMMEKMKSFNFGTNTAGQESGNNKLEANYLGNWTLLQQGRQKYSIDLYLASLRKQYESNMKNKIKEYGDSYTTLRRVFKYESNSDIEKKIEDIRTRFDAIYSHTTYVKAAEKGRIQSSLGVYENSSKETVVFKDALVKNEEGVRVIAEGRHKDIIDAHEKTHAVYSILTKETQSLLREPFGVGTIGGYKPGMVADEILARMAQLKNYFGFSTDEIFSKKHLEYAKSHYIKDTGMDNNMLVFFDQIIDVDLFAENMNTIPC